MRRGLDLSLIQFLQDGAAEIDPAGHPYGVSALDDSLRLLVIEIVHALEWDVSSAYLEDIPETLVRYDARLCSLLLDDRIDAERRSVQDDVGLVQGRPELFYRVDEADRGVRGSRRRLCHLELPSLSIKFHRVYKRASGVDAYPKPSLFLRVHSGLSLLPSSRARSA